MDQILLFQQQISYMDEGQYFMHQDLMIPSPDYSKKIDKNNVTTIHYSADFNSSSDIVPLPSLSSL